ncbi:MAG TPA: hypothetical protein VGF21_01915 [Thermoleophilaceae bacterium]|jgi:hypothetical protein
MSRIKQHLTYANVTATLALFIALGGSSYAALHITGRQIRNNSVTGKDIRNNSLTGRDVREKRLGQVSRARTADRLGGFVGGARDSYSSLQLLDRCPAGTIPKASVCPETPGSRPAQPFGAAASICARVGEPASVFGRRLPTVAELKSMVGDQRFQLAPGGELTSDVVPSGPNSLDVVVMAPDGSTSSVTESAAHPFRCVADPTNVID